MSAAELARLIEELSAKLGPAGERVFALALRQVYIDVTLAFLALLVIAAVLWAATRVLRRHISACHDDYCVHDLALFLLVGSGMLALVVSAWLLCVVSAVLNPEYAALRALLGAVR